MTFAKVAEKPALKLINADGSPQEFFTFPDVRRNGVPALGLMHGEVLERIATVCENIVYKRDVIQGVRPDRFRSAAAVIRLAGVTALGRGVPSEQLVVIRGMSVAHLGIVA